MARPFSATSRPQPGARPEPVSQTTFPVEVVEVMLSESHPEFSNSNLVIGSIRGRRYDTERGTPAEDLPWYNPIDPSELKIPLIGESVLLIESPNPGVIYRPKSRDYCYIATVGILRAISNNAYPAPTRPLGSNGSPTTFTGNMGPPIVPKIGDYVPDVFISPLMAFEGDRIIQGRWGNSIRFSNTSNGSEDFSFWNGAGSDGDPITIISNGIGDDQESLTRMEDLNNGSSNIILSSTQELDLEASNKLPPGYTKLNEYVSSQIVLSSNKIVLNSMEDNVVISGKKGVSISTPEWKADFTEMMDILKGLLAEMKAQADGSSPFVTGAGPTGINAKSKAALGSLETRLGNLEQ